MVFLAIWDIALCPVWRLFSVRSRWHPRITILGPFIRSPLSVLSSSCWSQYCLAIHGTLVLQVGQPSWVKLCIMARIGSVAVSTDICLILSVVNPWWAIRMSSSIVVVAGLGSRDRASARSISLPGLYFIAVYIDSYVTMSSDLYGTCRHCFYGTRFGYCSKGTKSSSDNIVPIFIRPII